MNFDQKVQYYLEKYPQLNIDGFNKFKIIGITTIASSLGITKFDEKRINCIREFIKIIIENSPSYQLESYDGTDVLKQFFNVFIAEGEFILAMLMSGYKMRWNGSSFSCNFRAKFMVKRQELIRIQNARFLLKQEEFKNMPNY